MTSTCGATTKKVEKLKYMHRNPVRRVLTVRPEDWPWSSASAHLAGIGDGVVTVEPLLTRIDDFAAFLADPFADDPAWLALRRAETVGRPLGGQDWIAGLERAHGRVLAPRKRGPKPKAPGDHPRRSLFGKLSP